MSAIGAAGEPISFSARDGRSLGGLLLRAIAPRGTVLMNAATGFRREFYLKFASYSAERGFHTLVYDYRGAGANAIQPLTEESARMSDWGMLDMPAALDALAARFPQLPLVTVGHSVGGQLIGCMYNHSRAQAHLLVATSTGYWRLHRAPFRYAALYWWKVHGPLMLRLHGYVPRGVFWRGDDLPRGVWLQWRRWCLNRSYFGIDLDGDLRGSDFGAVRAPILVLGFTDDPIATPRAVEALLSYYSNAPIERRWTRPADVGARAIGHHGFFAERHRDSLWREALDWIEARCA